MWALLNKSKFLTCCPQWELHWYETIKNDLKCKIDLVITSYNCLS